MAHAGEDMPSPVKPGEGARRVPAADMPPERASSQSAQRYRRKAPAADTPPETAGDPSAQHVLKTAEYEGLLVGDKCCMVGEDTDEDSSEFLDSANALVQTVFWAVAEWQKLCWCYPGRSRWFHDAVLQYWDDRQWIENFRMTRQTLFEIADVLRPYLMQRDTVMRSAIPVEERVAIRVYFLASRSCYRTIAHVFQKGTSTIASVMVEVCLAIEPTLLKEEVRVVDFNKVYDTQTGDDRYKAS
ncbi:hypothetical protein JRQ81_020145 [Phrynocephalus forsythii]|uniref:DUF8040 domain-containing protein n=1 Tax=Phrynocephalus forsythii TaxID=171643 RepID=A0A9Q1AYN1_9SAUR|nr:hypothetical protein JRQ81_020145 [Phrynocephalus forsythii]